MLDGILSETMGARRPWDSIDAVPTYETGRPVSFPQDEKWMIEACLRCPFEDCHDCFNAWRNAFSNIRNDTNARRRKKGARKNG